MFVSLFLLAGAVGLFGTMGGEFIPNLDEGDIALSLTLKPGPSLRQTIETTGRMETILKNGFPEVRDVISKIGTAEIPTDPMPIKAADVMVLLKEPGEWTSAHTKEELIRKMERALSVLPGINVEFTQPIQVRFNELMTGVKSDIAVKIYGEDLPTLANLNRILKAAFAGEVAGAVFAGEKRFDLVVRLDSTYRQDIDNIRRLYVDLPNGQQVPLAEPATIRNENAPMQISRDNARSRFERQELDRQTELNREEVGARRKLQQSTADFETNRALLTSLKAQLAQLHLPPDALRKGTISRTIPLMTPISGYVDKVSLQLGQYVGTTDELVEIVGKEHLYLELRVFENDIRKVKEGQLVRFTIPQQQTDQMQARVYRVGQAFDPQSKTVLVHANLAPNGNSRLFAGSYVRATILADPRQVLALPDDALAREGNRSFVNVRPPTDSAGTYQFQLVPVRTGVTQNHQTEVELPKEVNPAVIVMTITDHQ